MFVCSCVQEVEFRLLDSLAWRRSEPLMKLLENKANQDFLATLYPHDPPTTTATTTQAASKSQTQENESKDKDRDKEGSKAKTSSQFALEVFFRKVLHLASDRLRALADPLVAHHQPVALIRGDDVSLAFPQPALSATWALIRHVLTNKWEILFDRHLDSIILCSIFAVGKVGLVFVVWFIDCCIHYLCVSCVL